MAPNFLERALAGISANDTVSASAVNLRVRNQALHSGHGSSQSVHALHGVGPASFLSFFNSILICSGGLSVFRRDAVIEAGGDSVPSPDG